MSEYVPVSEQEFAKAEAVFRSDAELEFGSVPVDEAAVAERIRARNSRAVILTGAPYVGPLYDALAETGGAQGAIIARFGVGHDGIDKALARARGIVVATTPGTLDVSVAEHALWLMGGLAKHIPPHDRDFRAGNWRPVTGLELEGKALGVIGFGAIAARKSSWSRASRRARGGHCSVSAGSSFSMLWRKVVTKQLGAAIVQRCSTPQSHVVMVPPPEFPVTPT